MLPDNVVVEVNSKPDCPHCVVAKAWLDARNVAYTEIVHPDRSAREAIYDSLGLEGNARTMPQVFLVDTEFGDRTRVGGADKLEGSGIA